MDVKDLGPDNLVLNSPGTKESNPVRSNCKSIIMYAGAFEKRRDLYDK